MIFVYRPTNVSTDSERRKMIMAMEKSKSTAVLLEMNLILKRQLMFGLVTTISLGIATNSLFSKLMYLFTYLFR